MPPGQARGGGRVLTTLNPAWGDTHVVMMARARLSKERRAKLAEEEWGGTGLTTLSPERGDTSVVTARALGAEERRALKWAEEE